MFTVDQKQGLYVVYLLQDEAAHCAIEVVPERGGIITRWTVAGQEILYLDQERFAHPEYSVRGGIPILFPICGNLPENTYTYQGQTYPLKQHGFARDLPWTVIGQETTQGAQLTLQLLSSEQTRAIYPFDFELIFTYRLQGDTLTLQQRYTNIGDEPMPFSTGLHPYFLAIDKSQLRLAIPATQMVDQRTKMTLPFTGSFDFGATEIDVAFRELSTPQASVVDLERGLSVALQADPVFSTLVFWTLQGKDFYCLEPWSAPRNSLNSGENLLWLAAGASRELTIRLAVYPV
ncbi:aldose epimerase family protein [Anthocerotibacter panamensis]|uniref:aldose epimerase family protein n=1 Tax=Anthocerotibacter panamensis TaxID=2857077 RepID=UPI001C404A63|nr:hypothetical protein [Anthocerotibacter panamensis]